MRQITNIDNGWKFFLGDLAPRKSTDEWGGAKARAYSFGATAVEFDDKKWRNIDVPHDFVMEGDYTRKNNVNSDMQKIPEMESMNSRHFAGGSLEGGIAWYRRKFDIPNNCEGKRIYICFDGIYRNSTIYLNEYFIGNHSSGYTSFFYDITDFVNIGGENLLAVRVDSTEREGWWYEGGGIYRHVWLEVTDNVHVEKWGTFVASTVDLNNNSAELRIETEVTNKYLTSQNVTVESTIIDANNNEIAKVQSGIDIDEWENKIETQHIHMENATLWDLENPYLYTLKTNLYADNEIVDTYTTNFGIRDVRFDANEGMYLNGKNVRVKGLCCHHDHAGVGIGMPDSVQEYRIAQMKSMGANGYRSAHNPPSNELLDICDKMGMLVMDETRRMSSCGEDLQQLRLLVKRDRNHPSIFIWGIGNEEIFSQDRPETARTTVTMKMEIKKLDDTRLITSAVVCWNGKERFDNAQNYIGVTKELDVMGFNYCKIAWDDYHESMSEQPMIITEAASNSGTRGCYSTDENLGLYYINDRENSIKCKNSQKAIKKDIAENEWKYFAERKYLSGIFIWTGMDYRGEPTPITYPAVYSQFGIFDYCGFPKDNYYYYKSWWTDEPILHVFPHWNHFGMEGEKIEVMCYSNLDEAEIFVNGKSYGKKTMERNWYLSWENVVYEQGELTVKGYKNGEEVMTKTVRTTDYPYAVNITPYKEVVSKNDVAIINISIVDKNGVTVPTADNELHFEIEGMGEFLGTGNGNPGSHESDKIPTRRAFNGLCQLLVKAGADNGEIKITATAKGIMKGECIIKVK